MSFVNRMHTSWGGKHVNIVACQILQCIADHINSKMSQGIDTLITARAVQRHLLVFLNCQIKKPSFNLQMKECLTLKPENFGCNYTLPSSFLHKLVKPLRIFDETDDNDSESDLKEDAKIADELGGPGLVKDVVCCLMGACQLKDYKLLKEVGALGKLSKWQVLAILKLEDANLAVGKEKMSANCTLILTEGNSAKSLAVTGLEVIGCNKYGVFPLRE
jgi:DNA topoisomerase-2